MQSRAEPRDSLDDAAEVWATVPDWYGYEVSNQGRVRSWKQRTKGRKWVADFNQPPTVLRPEIRNGYAAVVLSELGRKQKKASVQRLVLSAFVGEQPPHMQAAHNNGIKTDNRLENLRWATPVENNRDKLLHGTHQKGDRVGTAKLSWASVAEIRLRKSQGQRIASLCEAYGVCRNTIINITSGKTWVIEHGAE